MFANLLDTNISNFIISSHHHCTNDTNYTIGPSVSNRASNSTESSASVLALASYTLLRTYHIPHVHKVHRCCIDVDCRLDIDIEIVAGEM